VDARNHGLQLRLNLFVIVQITLVKLLLVARHGSEVGLLVSFPANLVIQKVFIFILLRFLLRLFSIFEKLIKLLSSQLLLPFEVLVEQLHPLLLVIHIRDVCVCLGILVHTEGALVIGILRV